VGRSRTGLRNTQGGKTINSKKTSCRANKLKKLQGGTCEAGERFILRCRKKEVKQKIVGDDRRQVTGFEKKDAPKCPIIADRVGRITRKGVPSGRLNNTFRLGNERTITEESTVVKSCKEGPRDENSKVTVQIIGVEVGEARGHPIPFSNGSSPNP